MYFGHQIPICVKIPTNGSEMRTWLESIMLIVAPRSSRTSVSAETQDSENFYKDVDKIEYMSIEWAKKYYLFIKETHKKVMLYFLMTFLYMGHV